MREMAAVAARTMWSDDGEAYLGKGFHCDLGCTRGGVHLHLERSSAIVEIVQQISLQPRKDRERECVCFVGECSE
jgi:hypothetical protein